MPPRWISFCQLTAHILLAVPLRLLFKIKTVGHLEKKESYILCANHLQCLDPFFALASLPLKEFRMLIPIRFITSKRFFKGVLINKILCSLGCIPVTDDVLSISVRHLQNGENIFIFPEGRVGGGHPKVGAVYLARESPSSYLIPLRIDLPPQNSIKIPRLRTGITVTWHNPVQYREFPDNLQPLADDLMRRIRS